MFDGRILRGWKEVVIAVRKLGCGTALYLSPLGFFVVVASVSVSRNLRIRCLGVWGGLYDLGFAIFAVRHPMVSA